MFFTPSRSPVGANANSKHSTSVVGIQQLFLSAWSTVGPKSRLCLVGVSERAARILSTIVKGAPLPPVFGEAGTNHITKNPIWVAPPLFFKGWGIDVSRRLC